MTRRRALVFAATATTVIAADQVTKAVVRSTPGLGEPVPVIDGLLWFTHVHNTGAAFGMFKDQRILLVGVGVLVLAAIGWVLVRMRPQSPLAHTGLALIAGGAVGNLIDRVVFGGVTDFFDLGWFPVFNVADIALDVGVALIVVWLLFSRDHHDEVADAGEGGEAGERDE